MLNLNPTTLNAVVEQASHDAAQHPRWLQAIARAIVELSDNPWIERGELHGLVIGSPSGNVYSANGTCQCRAHEFGQPCWHRAAARLVRLHDEREASAAKPDTWEDRYQVWHAKQEAARIAAARLNELFA
jgi:hypothetical protein